MRVARVEEVQLAKLPVETLDLELDLVLVSDLLERCHYGYCPAAIHHLPGVLDLLTPCISPPAYCRVVAALAGIFVKTNHFNPILD